MNKSNQMKKQMLRQNYKNELAMKFTFYKDNNKHLPITVTAEQIIADFITSERYKTFRAHQINFEQFLLIFLSEQYGSFGKLNDKEWDAINKSYKLTLNEF
tara:strand:+ start:1580 stop:1882 length:303 start_codon:yes stop_codon:yes gene_type:complete